MKAKRQLKLRRVQRPERPNDDLPSASKAAAAAKILDSNPIPTVGRYVLHNGKLYGPSK